MRLIYRASSFFDPNRGPPRVTPSSSLYHQSPVRQPPQRKLLRGGCFSWSSSTETVSPVFAQQSQRRTRVSFSRGHLRRRVVLGRFHCNVIVCSVFAGNQGMASPSINRRHPAAVAPLAASEYTLTVGGVEASTSAPSVLEVALAASPLISSPVPASRVAASPFVASPLPLHHQWRPRHGRLHH